MKLVFFDTDFVSNWHKGDPKFAVPIGMALAALDAEGPSAKMLTMVNYHELLVWAVKQKQRGPLTTFLRATFSPPTMFDEISANRAAEIQDALNNFPVKGTAGKVAYTEAKDVWFRDVAMLGIAHAHGAAAVVTCSRDLAKFRPAMGTTRIIIVEEYAATGATGDEPQPPALAAAAPPLPSTLAPK